MIKNIQNKKIIAFFINHTVCMCRGVVVPQSAIDIKIVSVFCFIFLNWWRLEVKRQTFQHMWDQGSKTHDKYIKCH